MAELLNESSVAKQLHCEVKTLQAWRCRGGGPTFIRVGRLIRYSPDDVLPTLHHGAVPRLAHGLRPDWKL
jgi:hypothetical protein